MRIINILACERIEVISAAIRAFILKMKGVLTQLFGHSFLQGDPSLLHILFLFFHHFLYEIISAPTILQQNIRDWSLSQSLDVVALSAPWIIFTPPHLDFLNLFDHLFVQAEDLILFQF